MGRNEGKIVPFCYQPPLVFRGNATFDCFWFVLNSRLEDADSDWTSVLLIVVVKKNVPFTQN